MCDALYIDAYMSPQDDPAHPQERSRSPVEDRLPTWAKSPEQQERAREYLHMAEGDRLHTYWRQHWTFGDDTEPPFPLLVFAFDDKRGRELLDRLDAMGLPYHHVHEPRPGYSQSGMIYGPLWPVQEAPGLHAVLFGWDNPMNYKDYPSLEDFFVHFHPRPAPGEPLANDG
jgi:hypothetical protein